METRRLEYFVVLTSERHFGKAAERLHISQSALSQQIQRLERDVGSRLIDRSAGVFELTPAGERVLARAHEVLDGVDALIGVSSEARAGRIGRLRVGIPHSVLYSQVPTVLRSFRRERPEVEVELRIQPTPALHEMAALAQIEVAFSYTPPARKNLATRELYRDGYLVVLPDDHRFASAEGLELAQLRDENLLIAPREHAPEAYDAIIGACIESGFSAHDVSVKSSSYIDQVGLVVAGMGVALLPGRLGRVVIPGARLVPLRHPLESRLLLSWNPEVANPARDRFIDLLTATLHADG